MVRPAAFLAVLGSALLPLSVRADEVVAKGEVMVSIKPLGLIAAAISEGVTEPVVLIEDGASPHHYALKPSAMRSLMEAKLVFWIGPDLERFLDKPLARTSAHTLALMPEAGHDDKGQSHEDDHDRIAETDHHDDESGHAHDHGGLDLHPWLDPLNALEMARAMHREMVALYPGQQERLDRNLARFEASITSADRQIGELLSPLHDRGFYVFHDAYGGFVEHFGLNQLGYFTLEPSQKPGARHLAEIRAQLEAQQAVCVLSEPQFSSALVESVTSGLALKQGEVDPLAIGVTLGPEAYAQYILDLAQRFERCLGP